MAVFTATVPPEISCFGFVLPCDNALFPPVSPATPRLCFLSPFLFVLFLLLHCFVLVSCAAMHSLDYSSMYLFFFTTGYVVAALEKQRANTGTLVGGVVVLLCWWNKINLKSQQCKECTCTCFQKRRAVVRKIIFVLQQIATFRF